VSSAQGKVLKLKTSVRRASSGGRRFGGNSGKDDIFTPTRVPAKKAATRSGDKVEIEKFKPTFCAGEDAEREWTRL